MRYMKNSRTAFAVVLIVAANLTLLVPTVSAAEFFGIVDSFGRRPRTAYMDVSVDTAGGPADITFDVFSLGGPISQFNIRTNSHGFASTSSFGNLFDLTGGQPMLVRARTSANASASAATLHIDSVGAPMTIGLWPTQRRFDGAPFSIGTEFNFALGSFRVASLLIASVGGSEQVVDIHKGTRSANGSGIFSNSRLVPFKIWRVDLTQNEALSNLVVTSTGPIIVQAVIDDGRGFHSFQVLPSV